MSQQALPHVTVAAVIEKNDRFLLVEESQNGRKVFNQPAGHMETGETLIAALEREVLEETAWEVKATGILGIDTYHAPNGVTYVRINFIADTIREIKQRSLDTDIIAAHWLSNAEILALNKTDQLRSPLVYRAIERYRAGYCYPLELLGALA